MPRSNKGGPSNTLIGLGVTRAHTYPLGVAPDVSVADATPQVEKPSPAAVKAVWVDYATLVFGYDVTGYTKAELIEMVEAAE